MRLGTDHTDRRGLARLVRAQSLAAGDLLLEQRHRVEAAVHAQDAGRVERGKDLEHAGANHLHAVLLLAHCGVPLVPHEPQGGVAVSAERLSQTAAREERMEHPHHLLAQEDDHEELTRILGVGVRVDTHLVDGALERAEDVDAALARDKLVAGKGDVGVGEASQLARHRAHKRACAQLEQVHDAVTDTLQLLPGLGLESLDEGLRDRHEAHLGPDDG
jgi:hypothetical protein